MKLKKNTYSQFFLLLTFFFVCWAAPQILQNMRLFSGLLPQILFSIVFAVIAGTLLPLEYSRYRLLRTLPAKRNLFLSFFITLLVVFLISILSEALPGLLTTLHPIPFYVRYALLSFCISFGLWVFAFFILPRLIPDAAAYILCTAVFFGFGFFAQSAFGDFLLSLEMFIAGLLLAIAQVYHNRPWLSFVATYLIIASAMIHRQPYNDFPLWLASLSCILMLWLIFSRYRYIFRSSRHHRH